MDGSHNRSIRQCRAAMFAHRSAARVGALSGYELALIAEQVSPIERDTPNRKWSQYLKGSLPHTSLRRCLVAESPRIKDILANPLWWSLSKLSVAPSDRRFWNSCVTAIRVNGRPYNDFRISGVESLCGVPGWERLGYLIFILRSDSSELDRQRRWLGSYFMHYLCIALQFYPARWVQLRIFHCIEALRHQGLLNIQDFCWPKDDLDFLCWLERYRVFLACIRPSLWVRQHWSNEAELLLWILVRDEDWLSQVKVTDLSRKLSRRIAERFKREASRCDFNLVAFNWAECDQSILSASDRAILSRFLLEAYWPEEGLAWRAALSWGRDDPCLYFD